MKTPRNLSSREIIKFLHNNGYETTRQVGSHIRLTNFSSKNKQSITIPNHDPIKVGTLNNILNTIAQQLNITKKKLIEKL